MTMKIKKRQTSPKQLALVAIAVLLILVVAYGAYAKASTKWPFTPPESSESANDEATNAVNYDPPTQEDVNSGQDAKRKIIDDSNNTTDQGSSNTPAQSPTDTKPVSVGVSFADVIDQKVEIRAFTPSVIEGNGKCTATLTKGSRSVSAASTSFIDSSSSQCRPIYIPVTKFPEKGTWNLIVTYTSPTSKGSSEKIEVSL